MTFKHPFDQLWEFQTAYDQARTTVPTLPDGASPEGRNLRDLRIRLLKEEFDEYIEGEEKNDIVEIADALGDIIYIALGTAVSYGLPLDEIFNEIHRSNMSKLGEDGQPIRREDGKVLKGPNYTPPDVAGIISKRLIDAVLAQQSVEEETASGIERL